MAPFGGANVYIYLTEAIQWEEDAVVALAAAGEVLAADAAEALAVEVHALAEAAEAAVVLEIPDRQVAAVV
ncbi:MAG: hypothetical protein FWG38_07175 [Defluviitaleaceae bacterium]|nr:hypothetical protein [Defluviitaleaceae bacterium]